ncbi:MAG TPA: tripartite tricarboxylate transporter substrate binding protein [Usitatibacter sp.]|nr:tripartite tricarboxylate transporter substrate binding protein [Usitatibacter sp.]
MRALRLFAVTAGLAVALVAGAALAQSYPAKPVKLIVTYPPGGSSDLMARILGQKLSDLWGQPVVIESKPGAAGSIGMDYAKREPADGYSFVIGNLGPVTVNPILSKVPYDSERDFVPVSLIATGPNILVVNPDTPVKTLGELIDYVKANPGKVNFGSSGPGSVAHLSGEMFKNLAKLDITHIAYKGGILSVQDLIAGHVQMVFSDALPAMQFIKAGRLRALAVTGAERSPFVPDIPTCAESGMPGLIATNWWGVLMPAGTPKAIVQKFHADIVKVMKNADLKERFAQLGVEAVSSTPEEFAAFMRAETVKYAKLIKEADIRVD